MVALCKHWDQALWTGLERVGNGEMGVLVNLCDGGSCTCLGPALPAFAPQGQNRGSGAKRSRGQRWGWVSAQALGQGWLVPACSLQMVGTRPCVCLLLVKPPAWVSSSLGKPLLSAFRIARPFQLPLREHDMEDGPGSSQMLTTFSW